MTANLSVKGFPEIFVIGDTATVLSKSGRPVPGVAPAAKQMGQYVGKLLAAKIIGKEIAAPFVYRNLGDLAAVGRKSALVSLGRFELSGFLGWLFWCVAHIWFLIGFRSRVVVTFSWIWSYVTSKRSARLISDRDDPISKS